MCGGDAASVKLLWLVVINVIRLHRSTTYVDASVVTDDLSLMIVNHAKTAKPIEMPFGLWTGVGRAKGNTCWSVRWGPDPPMRRGSLEEERGRTIVKYRDSLPWAVQKRLNWLRYRLASWVGWAQRTMSYMGSRSSQEKGQFWRVSGPLYTMGFRRLGKTVSCAKSGGSILTIYTSYDVLLCKSMHFGGRGVTAT